MWQRAARVPDIDRGCEHDRRGSDGDRAQHRFATCARTRRGREDNPVLDRHVLRSRTRTIERSWSTMEPISRRRFIKAAGAAAATLSTNAETEAAKAARAASSAQPAQKSAQQRDGYTFFNTNEARFVEAAAARLIPSDETGPGATEAGVS